MPVPPFHHYLDPVLAATADGEVHTASDLASAAKDALGLTDDDLRDLIPSGKRSRHQDRAYWAMTYLFQAGLLQRPGRGQVRITSDGRAVLSARSRPIDLAVLSAIPAFQAFKTRRRDLPERTVPAQADLVAGESSPVDAVAALIESANDSVAADLLGRLVTQPPAFLERVVLQLLAALGYGGLEATSEHLGGPGDEGLDGVIRQDVLGLDVVYIQAKRYALDRRVGRPDIQAFVGALTGAQANRGVFITTSSFTAEARTYADRVGLRLVLIDGTELARLMVQRNVGVSVEDTFYLKRIDEDFFDA